jgi:hypothetical protein
MHIHQRGAIALLALTVAIAANGLTAEAASAAGSAGDSSTLALVDRALDAVGQSDTPAVAWTAPAEAVAGATLRTPAGAVAVTPASGESLMRVAPGQVQAVTVLRNGADVTSFDLALPDGFRAVPAGAAYDIVTDGGHDAGSIVAGHIDTPWAVDADGDPVTTRFSLHGNTLTQTIDPQKASFPVVVDPLVTFGLANAPQGVGLYVNLLGSQMRAIAATAAFLVSAGPTVLCASSSQLPPSVRWFVVAGCAAFGYAKLVDIIGFVRRAYESGSYGFSTCYQTRVEADHPWVRTDHANCE